jgi:hypothetical protein
VTTRPSPRFNRLSILISLIYQNPNNIVANNSVANSSVGYIGFKQDLSTKKWKKTNKNDASVKSP